MLSVEANSITIGRSFCAGESLIERRREPMGLSARLSVYLFIPSALISVLLGCSSSSKDPAPWKAPESTRSWVAGAGRPISDTHALQLNDYLIYPVQWGRAENLAVTVEEVLRNRYGNGVRVVPHTSTNKLLIYVPPYHEREERSGVRAPRSSVRSGRSPPSSTGASERKVR